MLNVSIGYIKPFAELGKTSNNSAYVNDFRLCLICPQGFWIWGINSSENLQRVVASNLKRYYTNPKCQNKNKTENNILVTLLNAFSHIHTTVCAFERNGFIVLCFADVSLCVCECVSVTVALMCDHVYMCKLSAVWKHCVFFNRSMCAYLYLCEQ